MRRGSVLWRRRDTSGFVDTDQMTPAEMNRVLNSAACHVVFAASKGGSKGRGLI